MNKTQQVVKQLNSYLKKWFAKRDVDVDFDLDRDFSYDWSTETVYYSFLAPETHDKQFLRICQEIEPDLVKCDTFLLSLFHEVGHYLTEADFEDDEWDDYEEMTKSFGDDVKDEKEYDRYYKHPIEYEATVAGMEMLMDNADDIPELLATVQKYERMFINSLDMKGGN